MIFVKGYGQMCNNILQYAHAYVWGKENHIPVVSMRFAYKYQYFEVCDYKYHHWMVYVLAKVLIKLRLMKYFFLDAPNDVTPQVISEIKNSKIVAVDGWYFRFPELFLKYTDEIKRQFAFKPSVIQRMSCFIEHKTKGVDIRLGVHIRRGDYKKWMGGKYFFDDEVYIDHIRQFMDCHSNQKIAIFICTNDRDLDIDFYRKSLGLESVYLSKGNEAEDLFLLSQCNYIIGVKSTFSLIASFYNGSPLYWIAEKDKPLQMNDFCSFNDLFMTV